LVKLAESGLQQAEGAQQAFAPLQTGAQSLFGLGNKYLAQNPEDVASNYMKSQLALLAPGREQELAFIQNKLQQQGRGGLSVAQGGNLGATTPEMEAYYNALAQQDLQLAAQAQQAGQQNVAFGTGLLGSGAQLLGNYQAGQVGALSPFTTYLGAGQTIEELGQAPLKLGAALGGQAAAYGGNVGQALLQGGLSAARTQQAGAGFSPEAGLLYGLANSPRLQTGFEKFFSTPSRGSTFSDSYQESIPVNNQSSGYY
jgi:hypothetical protein